MRKKSNISRKLTSIFLFTSLIGFLFPGFDAAGQKKGAERPSSNSETTPNQPAREPVRSHDDHLDRPRPIIDVGAAKFPDNFRSIDGSGNNGVHPDWGATNTAYLRLTGVGYGDGIESPSGADRPNARLVSNWCASQEDDKFSRSGYTDMMWQWGQFLDHDIDLTPVVNPLEPFDIPVPAGDPWFDPTSTGEQSIPLDRSSYVMKTGVREQVNEITAFIDASNVYGSDVDRSNELRTLDGSGKLKMSAGGLLPRNTNGFPNAPTSNDASFFLAGDFRANEQVGLTVMHTLWVREHNKWARLLRHFRPDLDGDRIFQMVRAVVTAEMQIITYHEFVPALLGRDALRPYRGYDSNTNPGIANVFATAAYRFGHTMLSATLLRLDESENEFGDGPLSLADAFFNPAEIETNGIEPVLRGLIAQRAQEVDMYCVDEVRNFLFGPPGSGGLDLASLNIQRGRDHGLPNYNQVRSAYGLTPISSFAEITPNPEVLQNLAGAYETVDQIDVWVGGLAERHVRGAIVGPTFHAILKDQFERLRDGDRFWYRSYFSDRISDSLENQTLSRIIRRNSTLGAEIPRDVFHITR